MELSPQSLPTVGKSNKPVRLVLPLLLIVAAAGPSAAVVFVKADAPPGGDGDSWATAYRSIQAAIDDADAADEEVWVAASTYLEPVTMKSGVAVYGGFAGDESDLAERDLGNNVTTIDASTAEGGAPAQVAIRIVQVDNITIDGLTITGAESNAGSEQGGINAYRVGGNNVIANCVVFGNSALSGGGFNCRESSFLVKSCTFVGNAAFSRGAGIYALESVLQFSECMISGNTAPQGAGIYLDYCGMALDLVVFSNCVISGNPATKGGGFYCSRSAPRIQNCTICDNEAEAGGALFCGDGMPAAYWVILDNTILAQNRGCAIYEESVQAYPQFCLFRNYGADFHDRDAGVLTGAANINMYVNRAGSNLDGLPLFLNGAGGMWTSAATYDPTRKRTRLIDASATFTPGELVGRLLNPDISQTLQVLITSNTTTMIEVLGDAANVASANAAYQIVDYHLRNGSAAIDRADAGKATGADYDGDVRPGSDGLVDIGADEADSGYLPAAAAPPVSHVEDLPPATGTAQINIHFQAYSAQAGIRFVELFFRKDGGQWLRYNGTHTESPIVFDTTGVGGDGRYELYTLATDTNDIVEEAPPRPDEEIVVAASIASSRAHVDKDATGSGSGRDWTNAFVEIGPALELASRVGAPEVWVAEGRYEESIVMPGNLSLYGGFAGWETSRQQRNPSRHRTIVDGSRVDGGQPALHVVEIKDVSDVLIDGFTITGGFAGGYSEDARGGGIRIVGVEEPTTVSQCVAAANFARVEGGGISCEKSSPTIVGCTVVANRSDWYGGGIACSGGSPRIDGCRFCGNSAFRDGGGITVRDTASPLIVNTVISGNRTNNGGGGMSCYACPNDLVRMVNCVLSGNWVEKIDQLYTAGAAIAVWNSFVEITNCTICSNTPQDFAGALYCQGHRSVTVRNSVFAENLHYAVCLEPEAGVTMMSNLFYANPDGDIRRKTANARRKSAETDGRTLQTAENVFGEDPMFLTCSRGAWGKAPAYDSATSRTRLVTSWATFRPGSLVGKLVNPDLSMGRHALIVSNSEKVIEVAGDVTGWVSQGDEFQIINYHVLPGSACIDTGTAAGAPPFDLENNVRPIDIPGVGEDGMGGGFDIGAYEYNGVSPCTLVRRRWHLYE